MKALLCALILVTAACAPKEDSSPTPIADKWLASKQAFIDTECGGVYSQACEDLYFSEFLNDLVVHYGLDASAMKTCSLTPSACPDEKGAELYFKQL